jgi:integrase
MWASQFPDGKPYGFVFPACQNGRIVPERPIANWRTARRHACRDADLVNLRFHDLRHHADLSIMPTTGAYAARGMTETRLPPSC